MLTLQEYLEDIEKLNKNNLEEMIRIYGKEEVYQYLNTIINSINNNENISLQVKETLLLKFKYFISHYQEEKEVEDIDLLKRYSNNEITMNEMINIIKKDLVQGV